MKYSIGKDIDIFSNSKWIVLNNHGWGIKTVNYKDFIKI